MIQSMYIGASGLSAQQKHLDMTANNIANASTTGFKKSEMEFKDALYTTMLNFNEEDVNMQKGSGVIAGAVAKDMGQGTIMSTGNALDCLINGEGFFGMIDSATDQALYTRNGTFEISHGEEGNFLVNNEKYVMGVGGDRIRIPEDSGNISIHADGSVYNEKMDKIGQIAVYTFENQGGLSEEGGSFYRETAASGQPVASQVANVVSGAIEGSNVDLSEEMTNLIQSQRAYQMASRIITMSDQMEGVANSLR